MFKIFCHFLSTTSHVSQGKSVQMCVEPLFVSHHSVQTSLERTTRTSFTHTHTQTVQSRTVCYEPWAGLYDTDIWVWRNNCYCSTKTVDLWNHHVLKSYITGIKRQTDFPPEFVDMIRSFQTGMFHFPPWGSVEMSCSL